MIVADKVYFSETFGNSFMIVTNKMHFYHSYCNHAKHGRLREQVDKWGTCLPGIWVFTQFINSLWLLINNPVSSIGSLL